MNKRIKDAFDSAREFGEPGFIPFITAGDPDPDTTLALIFELAELGSTVIELGVPFTDPMADGPVIQRSSQRALENGEMGIPRIIEVVAEARKKTEVPIVLFGYLNPFLAFGIERLCREASEAGVDGFLITDLIEDEFSAMSRTMASADLDLISLVAPTTTDERLARIAEGARGFIYAVSRTGVTGEGAEIRDSARDLVRRVRSVTDLPVAVGFGISTREQLNDVLEYADAAVVGSAIVSVIEDCGADEEAVPAVRNFVLGLIGKPDAVPASGRRIAH
ncbi:MAG TPA: tryptophan synthase subunit alpha [Aridibacter sp.]|nr:tryptophan synthase subunit alpha [Aridibacter sp.]